MSSKGRGADSVESDFYATPAWATEAILKALEPSFSRFPCSGPFRVLEPTAGKGAIVKVLRKQYPEATIDACELDSGRADQLLASGMCNNVTRGDFAEFRGHGYKYDLILTNPPFTCAISIIERTFEHLAPMGLNVHLLRQAILASATRTPFWRRHKAHEAVLPKRPQFARSLKCKSDKRIGCKWSVIQEMETSVPSCCPLCASKLSSTSSDSADYAWFVFGEGIERTWDILDTSPELPAPAPAGTKRDAGAIAPENVSQAGGLGRAAAPGENVNP